MLRLRSVPTFAHDGTALSMTAILKAQFVQAFLLCELKGNQITMFPRVSPCFHKRGYVCALDKAQP